jgi:hypothetical protein
VHTSSPYHRCELRNIGNIYIETKFSSQVSVVHMLAAVLIMLKFIPTFDIDSTNLRETRTIISTTLCKTHFRTRRPKLDMRF